MYCGTLLEHYFKENVQAMDITHVLQDRMAAISRQYFQMPFHEWKVLYLITISLKFVPKIPIDNNRALV